MQTLTLTQLNETFGTKARPDDLDPAVLRGETLADIRLSLVPGVKAVYVPDVVNDARDAQTLRAEIESALGPTARCHNYDLRDGHDERGKTWHVDGLRAHSEILPFSANNSRVRVLVPLENVGTECALGRPDESVLQSYDTVRANDYARFLQIVSEALKRGDLQQMQCQPFSCLAMAQWPVLPPGRNLTIKHFIEAISVNLPHRAPQTFGQSQHRLCDTHIRTETPDYAYRPYH